MIRLKRVWEQDKKLKQYLDELNDGDHVLLIFWHGLGDLIMFLEPFEKLRSIYPRIQIDLAVQKGLGFEEVTADLKTTSVKFIDGNFMDYLPSNLYKIISDIDFPMNEGQTIYTKGEWCCIHELGIDPIAGHKKLTQGLNRLVGVHFNITCLPDSCNPDEKTAERIWNDILEAGYVPIETHFQHVFHNPKNEKFPFIDCTVRRVRPRVSTLVGLLESCFAFVGVVSGNLHTALSVMPHDNIFFLDKDFHLASFVKDADKIAQANLKDYKGEVKDWLIRLETERISFGK